jgi:hypothetical protein
MPIFSVGFVIEVSRVTISHADGYLAVFHASIKANVASETENMQLP